MTLPRRQGFTPAPFARTSSGGTASPKRVRAPMRRSPAKSFPKDVAALLAERDPWCVHCGSPFDLELHHRRLKGIGGDSRPCTQCSCNGVRLCRPCHAWAHSGDGRREAGAEGLIVLRSIIEPGTASVLVHLEDDRGGVRKYPSCDGDWLDEAPEVAA